MKEAVKEYCQKTGQKIPRTTGEVGAVIYQSLAECYGRTAKEIEAVTGEHYNSIYIIGGGANADYLSRLTADAAGRRVTAGPTEATAAGNLAVQMKTAGLFESLKEARTCIRQSFPVKTFEPDAGASAQ